jgi:hypothetical protein
MKPLIGSTSSKLLKAFGLAFLSGERATCWSFSIDNKF